MKKQTTLEEHKLITDFIKMKSVELMKHEKKNSARIGFSEKNFENIRIGNRNLYFISTNIFEIIINEILPIATNKFTERFGTGNAKDVISAIHAINPWFDLERYIESLKTENFCYVLEIVDNGISDKILRIDLYRDIKPNSESKFDFVGGIFHCYKHFSFDGKPLSTSNEINDLKYPKELLHKIAEAFFIQKLTNSEANTYVTEIEIDLEYNLRLVFYYEENTDVYFIKTAYKIPKNIKIKSLFRAVL